MLAIEDLPEIDFQGAEFKTDPIALISELRGKGQLARSTRGVEVLSHHLCMKLARDKRLRNSHPNTVKAIGIPEGPVLDFKRSMLLGQGQTEARKAIRQVFVRHLGPSKAQEMRHTIRSLVDELLVEFSASGKDEHDFLNDFAMCLPSRLYCHWVGAPKKDAIFAARISEQVLRIFEINPDDVEAIVSGYEELFPYVERQIEEALRDPKENVLGGLVGEIESGVLTRRQVRDFACMLLEAATDNTSHQIALCVGAVLSDEQLWQRLLAEPELIPGATKEAIRLNSRIVRSLRFSINELELEGVRIPPNTAINLFVLAANLDPEVFPVPEAFNPARAGHARIQTFGGGAYSCLGEQIAQVEIEETLYALTHRFPRSQICRCETTNTPFFGVSKALDIQLRP